MAELTLRTENYNNQSVNRPLTNSEIDQNFINIDLELATKAPLDSAALTGVPTAPTATAGTNTQQLATTTFANTAATNAVLTERTATATISNKTLTNPTINSATLSGTFTGTITYSGLVTFSNTIQANAATVTNGVYTEGDQTINGLKTFTSPVTAATEVIAGTGSAGERRFRLKNAVRDVYFYLTNDSAVGLWDATSGGPRWTSAADGTFSVPGTFNAATINASLMYASTPANTENSTRVATTAYVRSVLQLLYPVGSIYMNATNSTNPSTLLGFGTWVAFGAGRVPVGYDAGDALFNAAEKTGGSKNAIVVAHAHTYSGSANTGTESADHAHYVNINTNSDGNHSHSTGTIFSGTRSVDAGSTATAVTNTNVSNSTGTAGNHNHNVSGWTGGISANHVHGYSWSGTTSTNGSDGTNANLQPYITVFMWKRTA